MSGIKVGRGQLYVAATGRLHNFEVKPKAMSISFIIDAASQLESDFPRYLLESHDGAYRKELSAGNDLVPYDQYLQLRFEELRPSRRYTLTREISATESEVVFRDVPYEIILDQGRSAHERLIGHDYAFGGGSAGSTTALDAFDLGARGV
jgi:hypothetical protein